MILVFSVAYNFLAVGLAVAGLVVGRARLLDGPPGRWLAAVPGLVTYLLFVLPGLLIIGWWADVPFWTAFGACATGGILGVMYTIPLRRALVSASTTCPSSAT